MRLDFEPSLRPAREGVRAVVFNLSPRNATDPRSPGMGRLVIKRFADAKRPGPKLDGRAPRLDEWSYSVDEQKWLRTSSLPVHTWPIDDDNARALGRLGHPPRSWHGHGLSCRFEVHKTEVRFYFEGRLIKRWPRTDRNT